jgi:hypothetical protein
MERNLLSSLIAKSLIAESLIAIVPNGRAPFRIARRNKAVGPDFDERILGVADAQEGLLLERTVSGCIASTRVNRKPINQNPAAAIFVRRCSALNFLLPVRQVARKGDPLPIAKCAVCNPDKQ